MPDRAGRWALIVQGGAKTICPDRASANRAGCLAAAQAGAMVLRYAGTAVRAAEAAVRWLEDDPTFNAGRGSVRNARGQVEMDAALMDGSTLDIGAVAAVRDLRNPIAVAGALLREPAVLLVAEGAEHFAAERGLAGNGDPAAECAPQPVDAGHDTVGCVALDLYGHLAAATSTGGLKDTLPGRVGDSPLPGCGLYADDAVGAVSLSGDGEGIMRVMLAARVMQALETQSPGRAAQAGIDAMRRVGGQAGAIVLDAAGRAGIAHSSDHFALAIASSDVAPRAGIHRMELQDLLDD